MIVSLNENGPCHNFKKYLAQNLSLAFCNIQEENRGLPGHFESGSSLCSFSLRLDFQAGPLVFSLSPPVTVCAAPHPQPPRPLRPGRRSVPASLKQPSHVPLFHSSCRDLAPCPGHLVAASLSHAGPSEQEPVQPLVAPTRPPAHPSRMGSFLLGSGAPRSRPDQGRRSRHINTCRTNEGTLRL